MRPKLNEVSDDKAIIQRMMAEIAGLKKQLVGRGAEHTKQQVDRQGRGAGLHHAPPFLTDCTRWQVAALMVMHTKAFKHGLTHPLCPWHALTHPPQHSKAQPAPSPHLTDAPQHSKAQPGRPAEDSSRMSAALSRKEAEAREAAEERDKLQRRLHNLERLILRGDPGLVKVRGREGEGVQVLSR